MVELIGLIFLLIVLSFFGAFVYKYRAEVKQFIKDPAYGESFKITRKKVLQRRIEDAQEELTWLEKKASQPEAETGD